MADLIAISVSPGFFNELWMSLVDTFNGGSATEGYGSPREGVVDAMEIAKDFRKPVMLRFTVDECEWLREWLRGEAGPNGRWADWGFEGAAWIRAGEKMIERIDEALKAREAVSR